MAASIGCPDTTTLEAYTRRHLAPQQVEPVEKHLSHCSACLERCLQIGGGAGTPRIPRCCIVDEIGRGRFGVVYKAWWLADRPRLVGLKVLSPAGEMEESRFEREIAVLKRIDSPWIVRCHESGTTDGIRYYIMDYVQGTHLDDYMESCGADLRGKLQIFQRVCHGVAHAHAQGVVHRDLKPRNILIDAEGHPHILDFGICTIEAGDWSSWERYTITRPGDVIGTLKYMSPEQAWGGVAGPVDERGDIWALGVMLYGILTDGGYPYSLKSTRDRPAHEALLDRIRKELPLLPRLRHLPRGPDLESLLSRCLAWEPGRRLGSAGELAEDLDRYIRGERTRTRRLPFIHRIERLAIGGAARSRWLFYPVFIAFVCVLLSAVTYLFDVGWRIENGGFAGPDSLGSAPISDGVAETRDQFLVAAISDQTVPAINRYAQENGIEHVGMAPPSWRAVHGRFMERLATVRPRAVVWDYFFRSPQPGDAELVRGIQALEQGVTPVILAVHAYDGVGEPALSPSIVEPLGWQLRHGAIVARDMVARPGEFPVAIKKAGGAVVPSLALSAAVAVRHPRVILELDWRKRADEVELLYRMAPGAYQRVRDRLIPTRTLQMGDPQRGVGEGDLLAISKLALRRPEEWHRRTVPYERLLTCGAEELREFVEGKVLVVGDFRSTGLGHVADRHPVRFGPQVVEQVPGCYLLADAVASLIDATYLRSASPLPTASLALVVCAALIGCLLAIPVSRSEALQQPHIRRWLWLGLLAMSAVSLAAVVATRSLVAVHAGLAGVALLIPLAGSFWVEFVRNRHRRLDRSRHAIEEGFMAEDTRTLTPRRPTAHPEEG